MVIGFLENLVGIGKSGQGLTKERVTPTENENTGFWTNSERDYLLRIELLIRTCRACLAVRAEGFLIPSFISLLPAYGYFISKSGTAVAQIMFTWKKKKALHALCLHVRP